MEGRCGWNYVAGPHLTIWGPPDQSGRPRISRFRNLPETLSSKSDNSGTMEEIGGKWELVFDGKMGNFLGPKTPQMHFLLGDVTGGTGNSHFPPFHKGKWGEMGGNGDNWGEGGIFWGYLMEK